MGRVILFNGWTDGLSYWNPIIRIDVDENDCSGSPRFPFVAFGESLPIQLYWEKLICSIVPFVKTSFRGKVVKQCSKKNKINNYYK